MEKNRTDAPKINVAKSCSYSTPPPQKKLRTKPRASGPTTELNPQSQELLFRE